MHSIEIPEFEPYEIDLNVIVQDGLLNVHEHVRKFFEFKFAGQRLVIRPMGFIGLMQLNSDLVVDVRPRIDADVARIFEVSGTAPTMLNEVLRSYLARGDLVPNLLEVFAHSLELAIEQVVERGFIRKFLPIREPTSMPSGRILFDHTIKHLWSRGISYEVMQERYVRSVDIDINRLLVSAVHSLGDRCIEHRKVLQAGQRRSIARILDRCLLRLNPISRDVHPIPDMQAGYVASTRVDPSRSYYVNAVALAKAIISGSGIALDYPTGGLQLHGLVLRMSTAFEAYVREVLRRESDSRQAALEVVDGNKMPPTGGALELDLGDGEARLLKPDIVVRSTNVPHRHLLVADAKYTAMRDGLDRDDLNQILVYGLAYRASRVLIVQPTDEDNRLGLQRLGNVDDITIYRYGLDISRGDLLEREVRFADDILELLAA